MGGDRVTLEFWVSEHVPVTHKIREEENYGKTNGKKSCGGSLAKN